MVTKDDFSEKDLLDEVQELIHGMIQQNKRVHVEWAVKAIIDRHPDIAGDDMSFYTLCAWKHLPEAVRSVARRYKPDTEGRMEQSLQLSLPGPGFDRLQSHYHFERKGDVVLIPIDELTDAELEEKAQEHDRMAIGNQEHARQLRRYIQYRKTRDRGVR